MQDFKLRCHCGATFLTSKGIAEHKEMVHNESYLDDMSFPNSDELGDYMRIMRKAS
jgi:hypothetical protein